ncbi:MAG: MlaD family protein [Prevotella sp.]|jgi:phospholipid/cholesterol/gamma-HCH transport system substrate-binding protein
MKILTNEVKIALVAIVGIVVLFFGLNFLKGMSIFSTDNTYYIKFHNISGLSSSNPIYADGYQVGVVKDIIYDYSGKGDILVKFDVDNNLRIPKGSSAEITSDIMGNVKMNLLLANNPRERVEPGDTLEGAVSGSMLSQVAGVIPQVEKLIPKLDSILTSLNALMADPALAQSLHNIRTITANLTVSSEQLNSLMANVNQQVPGVLGKANTAMSTANSVLENTDKFTANLAAIDVDGTMRQVNEAIANVNSLTTKMNSRDNTLGLLMNDASLYHNLNSTVAHADSLMINLREHPKRYVHFSLFGKKDK